MNRNRFVLGSVAIIVFTGLGCRQEPPGAPPSAPTPKTSNVPTDLVARAPSAAAPNETTRQNTGSTAGDNLADAVVTGKVRAALLSTER